MKILKICALITLVIFMFDLSSCTKNKDQLIDDANGSDTGSLIQEKLLAPTMLMYNTSLTTLSWNEVENAVEYEVIYNGDSIIVTENSLDILYLFEVDKEYEVSVCAIALDAKYNSDYSESILATLESTKGLLYTFSNNLLGYSVSRGKMNFYQMPETIIIEDFHNGLPVVEISRCGFSIDTISGFEPNTETKRVRLPKNLKKTGYACFSNIANLENVYLHEGIEEIADATFSLCSGLNELELPKSLKRIGNSAFAGCGFTEFIIPAVELGNGVLAKSKNLQKIVFSCGIKAIPISTCDDDEMLQEVIFPSSLESIGYASFRHCNKIKNVTIPKNVTHIDDFAFSDCEMLEYIDFLMDKIDYVGGTSFKNTKWYSLQDGLIRIKDIAIGYNNMPFDFDLIIPNDVTIIPYGMLSKNTCIRSLYIPSSVSSIGNFAFSECDNLEKVVIESINFLPVSCFQKCKNLKEVIVKGGLQLISMNAFRDCEKLETLNLPSCLTKIDSNAFSGCISLKEFDFDTIEELGSNAFFKCGIVKLCINHDLFDDTFRSENLTTIIIGKNVTNMPKFNYCPLLNTIYYEGTADEYKKILRNDYDKNSINNAVLFATIYYYSETEPIEEGNYWHYVDGVPTVWE